MRLEEARALGRGLRFLGRGLRPLGMGRSSRLSCKPLVQASSARGCRIECIERMGWGCSAYAR